MFVQEDCTVENVEIQQCGSYGVKTRASLTRIGKNHIQLGPWDNQPWNMNFEDDSILGMSGAGLFGSDGFDDESDSDTERQQQELQDMLIRMGMAGPGGLAGMRGFGDFDDIPSDEDFSDDDFETDYIFLRPDVSTEGKSLPWLRCNGLDDELCDGVFGSRTAWEKLTEAQRDEFRNGGCPV